MNIVLLSDSHGPIDDRIRALAEHSDGVVHAGDFGARDTLLWLRSQSLHAGVRGNNDIEAAVGTGHGLADEVTLTLSGGAVTVIHGHQFPRVVDRHRRLRERFPQSRLVVYGHSHKLVIDKEQIPWLINPGACGRVRTFGGPSCVILTVDENEWRVEPRRFSLAR